MTLPPIWPSSLRQAPLVGSWSGGPKDDAARFDADYGPPIVRRRTTADLEIFQGVVFGALSDAQRATFKTFFSDTLAKGTLAFAWRDPVTGDLARWQIIGDGSGSYLLTARGGGWHDLSLTLMKLPGTIWYAPYATQTGDLRLPYVVADYENGIFGVDGVKTTASAVAAVAGTFDVYTTATDNSVTEELNHAVIAGDIPASAPVGVKKIVAFIP